MIKSPGIKKRHAPPSQKSFVWMEIKPKAGPKCPLWSQKPQKTPRRKSCGTLWRPHFIIYTLNLSSRWLFSSSMKSLKFQLKQQHPWIFWAQKNTLQTNSLKPPIQSGTWNTAKRGGKTKTLLTWIEIPKRRNPHLSLPPNQPLVYKPSHPQ